jgi:hypothetical protein
MGKYFYGIQLNFLFSSPWPFIISAGLILFYFILLLQPKVLSYFTEFSRKFKFNHKVYTDIKVIMTAVLSSQADLRINGKVNTEIENCANETLWSLLTLVHRPN